MPSEASVYKQACKTLRSASDLNLPDDTRFASAGDSQLYVCKNAARADIPCTYTAEDGTSTTVTFTVWFKRIARTWEADRYFAKPSYDS